MKVKVKKIRPESKSSLKTAVKNVQKILKKDDKEKVEKSNEKLLETELKYKSTRGIVCVSHIPHGFYEEEMKGYFAQFGKVTRVRVVRSKKTGNSRGYGYVEFKTPEVAKIAAETMANYLMGNRLLKATYIPPEKQHFGYFFGKSITTKVYPKLKNRRKEATLNRKTITDEKYKTDVKKSLKRLNSLEKKLKDKGIDYKLEPVDVPKC